MRSTGEFGAWLVEAGVFLMGIGNTENTVFL